ncbi:MAG: mannose-1-phosphate guanylyltransferase/mannose-6-phosphate isomerase, partial [Desulfobulbaceae bacterium]|nr:mannose-1-phosphate guanylyltransferase/mannose-6-phosphate isomerase [Desulfobulbaceae bacterium]
PQGPETGYGYIRRGKALPSENTLLPAYHLAEFVEKPDLKTAQAYVESGEYQWNSGMFLFRADSYLTELAGHHPTMTAACKQAYEQAYEDLDFLRIKKENFAACPDDSIDYAVMEKTDKGVVVPINPGWNDIGSWTALWEVGTQDKQGNVFKGDVLAQDTENSFVHAESRMVACVGLKDHIVVETADAVLVAAKDRVQNVKAIVNLLKKQGRGEADLHRKVYRPWGSYESITKSDRFQVKLITVRPGSILSLQMHHHRAEHWIVVRGTARVTKGDKLIMVGENESIYIPLGVNHRLENPGVIPLELIEIQSGSYLGEDDIIRFEDNYGRANSN